MSTLRCSSGKSEVKADHKHWETVPILEAVYKLLKTYQINNVAGLFTGLASEREGGVAEKKTAVGTLGLEVGSQKMRHKEMQFKTKPE